MKVFLLAFSTFVFAGFGCQCSQSSKIVKSEIENANHASNVSTAPQMQSHPEDLKRREDLQRQYEAMQNAIKRESLELGMENLREHVTDSETETETRIWVGFGLAYPRCFILKNLNGKQKAFYVIPKKIVSKAAMDIEVSMTKTVLDAPQSGWYEFERFLKSQGIDSPIRLSLDDKHLPDPDEESIVVEVKSGTSYSMVFFSLYTENEDGRKLLEVCRNIEREFNIKLGCGL